ncbi:MAG: type II toxin-antitoxin system HicA family toxin [Candidatus Gastranaerophilaceae bacterium]|jgi:hypothetical protein
MSKFDKVLKRFMSKPKDFTWDELTFLLKNLGFNLITGSGSRRKFIKGDIVLILHEPHPQKTILVCYIKETLNTLKKEGLI